MLTNHFLKDVLSGQKSLLKGNEVKKQTYVPRYAELHLPTLWSEVKQLPNVARYFPNSFITHKRIPNREYLFTVWSEGPGERRRGAFPQLNEEGQG